ncbi:ABC transporter, ATP-binding protein, partial [gut metagenome]
MINLAHLSFHYPQHQQNVFENFSLELQPGKIYGLLGKNGSGKSTLLQLICGLLTPQKGEAMVNGKKVRQRLPETMQQLFFVPEEFTLPPTRLKAYILSSSG